MKKSNTPGAAELSDDVLAVQGDAAVLLPDPSSLPAYIIPDRPAVHLISARRWADLVNYVADDPYAHPTWQRMAADRVAEHLGAWRVPQVPKRAFFKTKLNFANAAVRAAAWHVGLVARSNSVIGPTAEQFGYTWPGHYVFRMGAQRWFFLPVGHPRGAVFDFGGWDWGNISPADFADICAGLPEALAEDDWKRKNMRIWDAMQAEEAEREREREWVADLTAIGYAEYRSEVAPAEWQAAEEEGLMGGYPMGPREYGIRGRAEMIGCTPEQLRAVLDGKNVDLPDGRRFRLGAAS